MNPKTILTEEGWKAVAPDCKGKDKDLLKALFFYWSLEDTDFDFRSKTLGKIAALAGTLKSAKEVAANPATVKYLSDMIGAAKTKQGEIVKAKVDAEKTKGLAAKTEAMTQKKAEADSKQQDQEEEDEEDKEEEETGDTLVKLKKTLLSLKLSKVPYYFIVCDAKPYGLIVSKKNISKSSPHKKELAKIAGGNTRPPKFGTCSCEGGKLIFEMEKPPSGLSRILQKWIKNSTGLRFTKIMVGTESAEDDEEPLLNAINPDLRRPNDPSQEQPAKETPAGAAAPQAGSAPKPGQPAGGPLSLSASVGRGGKNKPEDVQAVQAALNQRVKAGLPEDGKCGRETIDAIMEFQKLLGQFTPDGLVQPRRGTARALASTAKLGPPPEPPKPIAPPKLEKATLAKAPAVWHGTRNILATNIEELKKGIRAHYGAEHPDVLNEIDENLKKLGGILGKLDRSLADSLQKAHAAGDDAARKAELKNAKIILTDYIKYVKSESMISHIDSNPFGVDTNLKKVLMDSLTHMAQAIG